MTTEEYGKAYKKGYPMTARFLGSNGLPYDTALEFAQQAWVKGWERLGQLRQPNMVLTWVNRIALNTWRTHCSKEPFLQQLSELSTPPKMNLAAIDVERILASCNKNDRLVLQRHYLEGFKAWEIAQQMGGSKNSVTIRLMHARVKARKLLGIHGKT